MHELAEQLGDLNHESQGTNKNRFILSITLDIELQGKSVVDVCSHWAEIDVCVAGPEVEHVADAVLGGDELVAAAVDEIVTSWNSR